MIHSTIDFLPSKIANKPTFVLFNFIPDSKLKHSVVGLWLDHVWLVHNPQSSSSVISIANHVPPSSITPTTSLSSFPTSIIHSVFFLHNFQLLFCLHTLERASQCRFMTLSKKNKIVICDNNNYYSNITTCEPESIWGQHSREEWKHWIILYVYI